MSDTSNPDTTPGPMTEPIIVKVAFTVPKATYFQRVSPPSILIHNEDRSVFFREDDPRFVRTFFNWLQPAFEVYAYAFIRGDKIVLDIDRGWAPRQEW